MSDNNDGFILLRFISKVVSIEQKLVNPMKLLDKMNAVYIVLVKKFNRKHKESKYVQNKDNYKC
jgi:hypothetical protein